MKAVGTFIFILVVLLQQNIDHVICQNCAPCNDPDQWGPWSEYGECKPVNGNLCYKQENRTRRYQSVFACADCTVEIESRRCGECDHDCRNTTGTCSCHPGYRLKADGITCEDLNECDVNNGGCQHLCKNTHGSHSCSCNEAYETSTTLPQLCTPKSCEKLASNCPPNSLKDRDTCKTMITTCSNSFLFNSTCMLKCPIGYDFAFLSNIDDIEIVEAFIPVFRDANFSFNIIKAKCVLDDENNTVKWNIQRNVYEHLYCRRSNEPPTNLNVTNRAIPETVPIGSHVATITVDDDINDNTTFTITNNEGKAAFYIDGTKLITLLKFNLKYLLTNFIAVNIRATDSYGSFIEQLFEFYIWNHNKAIEDIQISNNVFNDSTNIGVIIGNLSAIDYNVKPATRKSNFYWELVDNGDGHFALQGNAIALVKQFIDKNEDHITRIVVQCSQLNYFGRRMSTPQEIYLRRQHINNAVSIYPFFPFSHFSKLNETAPVGTVYHRIYIVDKEKNAINITYKPNSKFAINSTTCNSLDVGTVCKADIVLIGELDYETKNKYTFVV